MADKPTPIAAGGLSKPPDITDTEDDAPAPIGVGAPTVVDGKIVSEAPMVSLQTKGVDTQIDTKGKEFIAYTFGLYIADERVHTIEDRYSQFCTVNALESKLRTDKSCIIHDQLAIALHYISSIVGGGFNKPSSQKETGGSSGSRPAENLRGQK